MGIVKTDTGKVLLGTSTKDIHQLWEGPVKKRAVYLGDVHVWPNYYIWGYENSVNITGVSNPPRVNNVSNGAIGNTYEVDPAGASGYVRVRSVESSFWHMISFDIEYSSSMTINNISCGSSGSSSATIGNIQITNTGEKYQSVKLSEDILPLEEQGWDCNIQFNIEVNSNTSDRTGYIKIVAYYDEFNIKHICDVLLFEWNQKPNTLYGYDIYWSELNPVQNTSGGSGDSGGSGGSGGSRPTLNRSNISIPIDVDISSETHDDVNGGRTILTGKLDWKISDVLAESSIFTDSNWALTGTSGCDSARYIISSASCDVLYGPNFGDYRDNDSLYYWKATSMSEPGTPINSLSDSQHCEFSIELNDSLDKSFIKDWHIRRSVDYYWYE